MIDKSIINVKVNAIVKERLTVLQGMLQIKFKKKVSLNKTIEHLLDNQRSKNS